MYYEPCGMVIVDHLLPHGDPDMIGGFRAARHCIAVMESRYVFTKLTISSIFDNLHLFIMYLNCRLEWSAID